MKQTNMQHGRVYLAALRHKTRSSGFENHIGSGFIVELDKDHSEHSPRRDPIVASKPWIALRLVGHLDNLQTPHIEMKGEHNLGFRKGGQRKI